MDPERWQCRDGVRIGVSATTCTEHDIEPKPFTSCVGQSGGSTRVGKVKPSRVVSDGRVAFWQPADASRKDQASHPYLVVSNARGLSDAFT